MADLKRAGKPQLHYVIDDYTDPWKNAPYLILQHGMAFFNRLKPFFAPGGERCTGKNNRNIF